jgi:hypothetical protein
MEDSYSFRKLSAAIIALSSAKDWEAARKEWGLVDIYDSPDRDTCLCGKYPIIEICVIGNKITNQQTEFGNHCVTPVLRG